MSDRKRNRRDHDHRELPSSADLDAQIQRKAERRQKAVRDRRNVVWFGLGMFGLIGWSVAIPAVAGALFGVWLDRRLPEGVSWTLTLLIVGITVGCLNAWRWLRNEGEV